MTMQQVQVKRLYRRSRELRTEAEWAQAFAELEADLDANLATLHAVTDPQVSAELNNQRATLRHYRLQLRRRMGEAAVSVGAGVELDPLAHLRVRRPLSGPDGTPRCPRPGCGHLLYRGTDGPACLCCGYVWPDRWEPEVEA